MFFNFGQRNFGKVDCVAGVFYVVTQFFHINFLPLIPSLKEPGADAHRH
jgi:hypothetical protein